MRAMTWVGVVAAAATWGEGTSARRQRVSVGRHFVRDGEALYCIGRKQGTSR